MFSDIHVEADRRMADYDREASRVLMDAQAAELSAPIETGRRGVRFPVPEWLKRAPFVLRSSAR